MLNIVDYFPGSHTFRAGHDIPSTVINRMQNFHEAFECEFHVFTGDCERNPTPFRFTFPVRELALCGMMTAVYVGLSNNLPKN
jgi:hypothetical protein